MVLTRKSGCLKKRAGFTLVEIMVAVVILSVGLLGMAAMTIMVIRGNRMAVRQTNATNLAQQLLERLKDVNYLEIGSQTTCGASSTSISVGENGVVCFQSGVDAQGTLIPVGTTAPSYNLYLKVCDSTIGAQAPIFTSPEDYCDTTGTKLVPELACKANLNVGEKELNVVTSFMDNGKCHHVALTTVVVSSL